MNLIYKIVLFVVSIAVLSACGGARGDLNMEHLNKLALNTDIKIFKGEGGGYFGVESRTIFELGEVDENEEIKVFVYKTYLESGITGMADSYILLSFRNEKLIFWGFPEEFLKSEDPKIRKIGQMSADLILKEIEKEKGVL